MMAGKRQAKQMANPNPTPPPEITRWKPGQSGNPKGGKKGLKQLSTLVQQILADEELLPRLIARLPARKRPKWYDEIGDTRLATAMIVAMGLKAVGGDDKAFTALRKAGYGDKLELTPDDRAVLPVYVYDLTPQQPKPKAKRASKPKAKRSPRSRKTA